MTNWMQRHPQEMPEGVAFVAISDGTVTYCAEFGEDDDLGAFAADFARTYAFNTPGDVHCVARRYTAEWDGEDIGDSADMLRFTIRSDDGRGGDLVEE